MSSSVAEFSRNLIADLRANGGEATSGPFRGRPVLILTTAGARTGQAHENPLVYTRLGEHHVIVASKGGAPTNPAWYHNLVANPTVTVEVLGEKFQALARVAVGEERDRLYRAHAEVNPGFFEYERRTTRKIPVIVLERLPKPA